MHDSRSPPIGGAAADTDERGQRGCYRASLRSHPRRLQSVGLVLTSACNLECTYCIVQRTHSERLPWTIARHALDLLLEDHHPEAVVTFHGGEPLLELPLLRRAVHYIEEHSPRWWKPRFSLATNGVLLNDGAAAFLARHHVDTAISFDGIEPAQEARAPGTFAALDDLLERLRRRQAAFYERHVRIQITLGSMNLSHLADSLRYFLEAGVRRIAVSPLISHDDGWSAGSFEELDRVFTEIAAISREHHARNGEVPFEPLRQRTPRGFARRPLMCGIGGGASVVVDTDGDVVACVSLIRSLRPHCDGLLASARTAASLGDLRNEDFRSRLQALPDAIFAHPMFVTRAHNHSPYGRCRDCAHFETCVVCPLSVAHIPGNDDPNRVPDLQCAFNLVSSEHRTRFWREVASTNVRAVEQAGKRTVARHARRG